MADFRKNIDISIHEPKPGLFEIVGQSKGRALRVLKDTIDDIADQIESKARELAPVNKDPEAYTWRDRPGPTLKEHPVDRTDSRELRGSTPTGRTVARAEITVAKNPYYAIFVHEGTSPYWAHNPSGVMTFKTAFARVNKRGNWTAGWIRTPFVRGQEAQPYLLEAYELVNSVYVPMKIAELKGRLSL